MKTLLHECACSRFHAIGLLLAGLVALGLPSALTAQTDDFNDGNDAGWTRYDPIGTFFGPTQAVFSFPSGGYRIQALPSQAPPAAGPSRAGALLGTNYSDFYLTADIVNWNDSLRQAAGLMARVGSLEFGTTTGYAFTWERGIGPTGGDVNISRVTGENPVDLPLSGSRLIHFEPGQSYRLVFIGRNTQFEGRVYQLPDTATPVVMVTGSDETYTNGIVGMVVYDNSSTNNGADATFDNFSAEIGRVPVITTQPETRTVPEGSNAIFTVGASGSAPFSYQWLRDGIDITGAVGSSYAITNVSPSDAGAYSVIVSNPLGSVSSSNATLTVTSAPPGLVYATDFEGTIGREWSRTNVSLTPVGARRFLGEFNNETARLTLTNLPPHTAVRAECDLYVIRSWDGNSTVQGPDRWSLRVDGPEIFQTTFNNHHPTNASVSPTVADVVNSGQAYPGQMGGAVVPPLTGASEIQTLGYIFSGGSFANSPRPMDAVYRLAVVFPHTSPSLRLDFASAQAGGLADESWGLDNVAVFLVPQELSPSPTELLVSLGSEWRYLGTGANLGTTWIQPAFNDSTWASGLAELGYGDGDETTVVSFGPSATNKYTTTYFRRTFLAANVWAITNLDLGLRRDDGGIVYLNGVEVFRSSMPPGAVTYQTFASATADGANESLFFTTNVSPTRLVEGTNVLAVEIHQVNLTSSDISFDLYLEAELAPCHPTFLTQSNAAGTFTFEREAAAVSEDSGTLQVNVRRVGGSAGVVSVTCQPVDGMAINGVDFVGSPVTLSFANGETVRPVIVPILDDALVENDETFTLRLTSPTGGAGIGLCTNLVATLLDDDGYIEFVRTNLAVPEIESPWPVSVRWTGSTNRTVGVQVRTRVGTALPNTDYAQFVQTVTFLPGQTNLDVFVTIHDDTLVEPDETILVSLGSPTGGASLPAMTNAVVTILDNDAVGNPGRGFNAVPHALLVETNDRILVAGDFTRANGVSRQGVARLNADGSLDTTFGNPAVTGGVWRIIAQADGKLLITGGFGTVAGAPRGNVARLSPTGALDTAYATNGGAAGFVPAAALQSDGRLIIGGDFTSYAGVPVNRIARLTTNGALDLTFNVGTGPADAGTIWAVAVQPADGKILVSGTFSSWNGSAGANLVRLNPDGSVDTGFQRGTGLSSTDANRFAHSIVVLGDGRIVLGGWFTSYNGQPAPYLVRLLSDGHIDPTYTPAQGTTWGVAGLTLQRDGRVLVCGGFGDLSGVFRPSVGRINGDGSLDGTFAPEGYVNQWASVAAQLSDGRVAVGGWFNVFSGFYRAHFAILNADGSLPDEPVNWVRWPATNGGNGHWYALTRRPDNWTNAEAEAVVAGGHLVSINSSNEQSFLEATFLKGIHRVRPFWIGFTDAASEGSFAWSSGEPTTFQKWQLLEPNDLGGEDHTALNWHFSDKSGGYLSAEQGPAVLGSWNDTPWNGTPHWSQATGPYFGIMEVVTHPSAPVITQQPQGQSVSPGSTATFNGLASGGSPLRYQWYFNGTNALAGATNADLILLNVQVQDAGSYSVIVSNAFGVAAGGPAVLAVLGCSPSTPGLVSWWRAESNALDSVGLHPGTLQGGLGFAPGIAGRAFSFDGANDYLDLGGWFNLQAFTIAFWVKPGASQVPYADIIDNNHTSSRAFVFQQDFTNVNTYYWEDFFPNNGSLRLTLTPDVWQFVAITRTAGNLNRLYLNGVQVGSRQSTNAIVYDGTEFLRLGNWGGDLARPWNGQMDDVMIFNRPLTAAEIRDLHQNAPGGYCGGAPDHVVLVAPGANWKYLDDGTDQGAAWRALNFDDSTWASGPAQLGYGDGDEATVVNSGPAGARFVTTYFRHTFAVTNASVYSNLVVRLLRDDGAVAYLNGVEIFRSLMPSGPIAFNAFAAGTVGTNGQDETINFYSMSVPPGLLRAGTNVLAVEIHQVNLTSSDISFDLELLATGAAAESPDLAWVNQPGGVANDEGRGVAVDNSGNVFLVGSFSGTGTFGGANLVSSGSSDVFLAKFSPDGNALWARRAGGTNFDEGRAVRTDAAGSCYVGGWFTGVASFGTTNLTGAAGVRHAFVAKYDGAGTLQWVRRLGGHTPLPFEYPYGLGLTADPSGNTWLTGFFDGTQSFGGFTLTSAEGYDAFVARLDAAGTVQWARQAGGFGDEYAHAVGVDAAGNAYVTGHFYADIDFGSTNLPSIRASDMFLAKYDPAGNVLWATMAGGSANVSQWEAGYGVALDPAGNPCVIGSFDSPDATFGGLTLTARGTNDVFLAKYSSAGNLVWVRQLGGTQNDVGHAIATDVQGHVFVTGILSSTGVYFDGVTLSTAGVNDIFVAKDDADATLLWARRFGGAGIDIGWGIGVDASGSAYLTGQFEGSAEFGAGRFVSRGGSDAFLVKLEAPDHFYFASFEGGAGPEWSATNTDVTPVGGRRFLGQFGNQTVTLTLNNLPAHASVELSFDLFIIRSWDGNGNCCAGIDQWDLQVSGGPTLLHTTFSNTEFSGNRQAYPDFFPGGDRPARAGASETNTLGFVYVEGATVRDPLDSAYRFAFAFAHTSNTLALQFSASGLQVLTNESWGLDNVRVQVSPAPAPPVIQIGPTNLLVAAGGTAMFNVTAIGTAPLTYQWLRNGLPVAGATNTAFTISNAQPSDAASYAVVLSNPGGAVTSANAALAVSTSDQVYLSDFSTQPPATVWTTLALTGAAPDILNAAGVDASVSSFTAPVISASIAASSANPPNATGPAVWSSSGGYLQTRPTGVRLTVLMATLVNTTATHAVGFTVSYDYAALAPVTEEVGGQRVYYSLTGGSTTWVIVPELSSQPSGRLSATVTLPALWLSGARLYLVFADDNGSGTPDTANQIDNFAVTANAPSVPIILTQPAHQVVPVGSNATFSVTATGFNPLVYQWFFNGATPITGATNASLTLSNVQPAQAGNYSLRVSNVAGMATSAAAMLTVVTCEPPPASGLVGWWRAENNGHNSAGTNHALLENGATFAPGRVGRAFSFDGIDDRIQVPDSPALKPARVSVEAWVKFNTLDTPDAGRPGLQFIVFKKNSRLFDFEGYSLCKFRPVAQDNFLFQMTSADGVNPRALSSTVVSTGVFYHVVGTYDGSFVRLYVNGVEEAAVPHTLPIDYDTFPVWFGSSGTNYYQGHFSGVIDEVSIYNRALTSNEIAGIYNAGSVGKCTSPVMVLVNGSAVSGGAVVATNSALVLLQSSVSNAVIRYTLNGAPPAGGILYTGALMLNQAAIVRAMAFEAGGFTPAGEADPVVIDVVVPPSVVTPPRGGRVGAGADVALNVVAVGTEPLAFQWLRDGVAVPGATNAMLLMPNIQPDQAGNFAVAVTNAFGAVTSAPVLLVVFAPPSFVTQPQSVTVAVGGTAMFSASALGPPPLEFQWRKNGVNIPGATNSIFIINNVTLDDGSSYTVVVASPGGTLVSEPARLTVTVPSPPAADNFASTNTLQGASGAATGTNNFATREGGEPLHAGKPGSNSVWYTWTAPAKGIATFRTTGSTFDTLLGVYTGTSVDALTTVVSDEDSAGFLASKVTFNATAGTTYHIAIDGFNGEKGSYVLRWELTATDETVPKIDCPPRSLTVQQGQDATFTVSATGSALIYQWLFNGVEISGATQASYTRSNVQPPHVGFYSVRVSSTAPQALESAPAILEIGPFPGVQSQDKPNDASANCPGGFAPATGAASSVAMGSVGSQLLVNSFNNVTDCTTTNCGGIPVGTRYFILEPVESGVFILSTTGSVSRTKMWVCDAGTSRADTRRTFLKCDVDSAPDGRSQVFFPIVGGRRYEVSIARLDNVTGDLRLNWKFGVPPRLASLSPHRFVAAGSSLTLSAAATNVVASGVTSALPPPSYAWYFNGMTLVATGPTLTLNGVTAAHAGQYTVVAGNDVGTTSAVVRVEVFGAGSRAVVSEGGVTELFADATTEGCGGAPAHYQWRLNDLPLPGETNRNLVLRGVLATQAGQYSVTVSNCFGTFTYAAAMIAVTVDLGFHVELMPGGQVILSWQTAPAKLYRVEQRASLGSGDWLPFSPVITGNGDVATVTDLMTVQRRFYRIVLLE